MTNVLTVVARRVGLEHSCVDLASMRAESIVDIVFPKAMRSEISEAHRVEPSHTVSTNTHSVSLKYDQVPVVVQLSLARYDDPTRSNVEVIKAESYYALITISISTDPAFTDWNRRAIDVEQVSVQGLERAFKAAGLHAWITRQFKEALE